MVFTGVHTYTKSSKSSESHVSSNKGKYLPPSTFFNCEIFYCASVGSNLSFCCLIIHSYFHLFVSLAVVRSYTSLKFYEMHLLTSRKQQTGSVLLLGRDPGFFFNHEDVGIASRKNIS